MFDGSHIEKKHESRSEAPASSNVGTWRRGRSQQRASGLRHRRAGVSFSFVRPVLQARAGRICSVRTRSLASYKNCRLYLPLLS